MYQVSGEYAMFWHASKAGAMDLRRVLMETLEGMRRAGMCSCVMLDIYLVFVNQSGEALTWLSVGSKVQMICVLCS